MEAKLFDSLENVHFMFVFQPFPDTADSREQPTLGNSIPKDTTDAMCAQQNVNQILLTIHKT
jgi:hypothetical protein